jgi:hypothetical protein
MKNGILRATLLGLVASASFSLTQAASLAATTNATTPTIAVNSAATNAAPAATGTDRFLLLGGH